jgi:hypothetical protein
MRGRKGKGLVEEALAASRTTQARNSVVAIPLALEFVVVGKLLIWN